MPKFDEFPVVTRAAPLRDLERKGRTVTAYAATFDDPYPVVDFDGDYDETINRTAFNHYMGQFGLTRTSVFFNHGMTAWGTPSDALTMPIAAPIDVRPDGTGLLTVSRYANTELADLVLQLIDDDVVTTMSFRGPIFRSAPPRRVNGRRHIERLELGLMEYGPVALPPANPKAKILAVRSLLTAGVDELTDEERAQLLEALQAGHTLGVEPSGEPDDTDSVANPVAAEGTSSLEPDELASANLRRREP